MDSGQIIEYDANDGLGIIRLDDGRKIRFSLTVCGYMRPELGKRVRVLGLTEGYGEMVKAAFVEEEQDTDFI